MVSKRRSVLARDKKIISRSSTRDYPFVFDRGKGVHVWDIDGKKYTDFAAGIAVMNVGHNHPDVMKAIFRQLRKGTHAAFADFYADLPVRFAEKLMTFLPKSMNNAFLSNSGTESVEAAYKIARWHTGRKWVVAFHNSFHGRTMGSLSMTHSKPVQRKRFSPFLPVKHIPYPYFYRMKMEPEDCSNYCLNEMEKVFRKKKEIAALFIEPIQGEGGYVVPPKSFVRGARKLCNEFNILLCSDEVQSGCFRTGKFMAISNFSVKPDVVSFAKALGGGLPLGATVTSRKIMNWPPGAHGTTFGGNLLACAAGIASLDIMKKKKLGENAKRVGKEVMKRLNEMKERYEPVGDIRGLGLMIGVEIVKSKRSRKPDAKKRDAIIRNAFENGLILLPTGDSVIRICPPLTITKEEAMRGLDIMERVVKS